MITSEQGLEFIARAEGEVLEAYKDPVGIWTIGVGHVSDKHLNVLPGLKISKDVSRFLLRLDVQEAEEPVNRLVKVPLSQHQFDALVSFVFNLGEGNFKESTLLKKLNAGDYEGAAAQFKRWVHAGGKVLPGLVKRRNGEAAMFEQK